MSLLQELPCPVCGALPGNPCTRLEGGLMPRPHSKRCGVFPANQFGRVAVRKVRRPVQSVDAKRDSPKQAANF
jgi:hypothetical protein